MKYLSFDAEKAHFVLPLKEHFANLANINESFNAGVVENFKEKDLTYIEVPEIVGITGACENVDTLFRVESRVDGEPLFFTQTGQLALEQALQSFHGVYTVIHSGRDELREDERHLRQFRLTEEEFDSTPLGMDRDNFDEDRMFEALLTHIQDSIQSIIRAVLSDHRELIEEVYYRDVGELEYAAENDFLRVSYEVAITLLRENGFPELKFGDDLCAEHEMILVELLNGFDEKLPLFITKYPKEIKFFNMKVSESDPRVVLSADLILPYSGESVGSAVREHRYVDLVERLLSTPMYEMHLERGGKFSDFRWYLDIIRGKKTNPHAGYGIGNERVMQYLLGLHDIRNCSSFYMLNVETGDFQGAQTPKAGELEGPENDVAESIEEDNLDKDESDEESEDEE